MALYKKIWIWNLSISTVIFFGLTIYRMTLDYNENGVYFHEGVTYDRDAIVAYATLGCFFLLALVGMKLFWKEKNDFDKK